MKKHRKKNDNTLTGSFIKAHCGEISDHQLVALLSLNANENDLEEAMAWDMGKAILLQFCIGPYLERRRKFTKF